MPLLAIQIGQNESDNYILLKPLLVHMDVIQCLQDDIKTLGTKANKEFFVISFSWGTLSEENQTRVRDELNRHWYRQKGPDTTPLANDDLDKMETVEQATRLYYLDLSSIPVQIISAENKTVIENARISKIAKESYDVSTLTAPMISKQLSFDVIKNYLKNKFSGNTIAEELGL